MRYTGLRRLTLLASRQYWTSSARSFKPSRTLPDLHQGAQKWSVTSSCHNIAPQQYFRCFSASPVPEERPEEDEVEKAKTSGQDKGKAKTTEKPKEASELPDAAEEETVAEEVGSAGSQQEEVEVDPKVAKVEGDSQEDASGFTELFPDGNEDQSEGAAESSHAKLLLELEEKDVAMKELQKKNDELKDKVLRTLAEMENMKDRVTRQADQAKTFAVAGFVKDLLDVADNLERALESVPQEKVDSDDVENTKKLLSGLLEGVKLTDHQLLQVFKRNGVQKHKPEGEKFDPNKHNAMFQVPGTAENAGLVAAVTKSGYTMHNRVVRPAEVGVYKSEEEPSG